MSKLNGGDCEKSPESRLQGEPSEIPVDRQQSCNVNKVFKGRQTRSRAVNLALSLKMKIDPSSALISRGGRESSSARGGAPRLSGEVCRLPQAKYRSIAGRLPLMQRGPRMSNNVEEEEIEDSGSVLGLPEQEENAKLGRDWYFLTQRPKSLCQRQEHLCQYHHSPPSFVSIFLHFLEHSPGSASPTKFLNTTSTSPPNRTMFWTPFQPPPEPPNFHALPRLRLWRHHMRALGRCRGKKYHHTTNEGLAGDI